MSAHLTQSANLVSCYLFLCHLISSDLFSSYLFSFTILLLLVALHLHVVPCVNFKYKILKAIQVSCAASYCCNVGSKEPSIRSVLLSNSFIPVILLIVFSSFSKGPPSPRATALHHYRPQFLQDSNNSQPSGKPLHPCQRQNNNLRELKLFGHFSKAQMPEPFRGNNIELTESGVRHMNRLKLPSGGTRRRVIKNRVKPKKFGLPVSPVKKSSFAGHLEEKDAYFNRAVMEDGDTNMVDNMDSLEHQPPLPPSRVSRPRQPSVGRPGVGGFLLHGRGSGGRRFVGRGARGSVKRKGAGLSRGPSHFNSVGSQLPQACIALCISQDLICSKRSIFFVNNCEDLSSI